MIIIEFLCVLGILLIISSAKPVLNWVVRRNRKEELVWRGQMYIDWPSNTEIFKDYLIEEFEQLEREVEQRKHNECDHSTMKTDIYSDVNARLFRCVERQTCIECGKVIRENELYR